MTLVSPEALAARLLGPAPDPDLVVVDVRWYLGRPGAGLPAYLESHLPGAIFLDLDTELVAHEGAGRHPLPSPADFAARMGAAGIGDGTAVVAYDDVGGWVAARLWWMLERVGLREVAVLDGGLPAWVAAGLPLETGRPAPHAPRVLTLGGETAAGRWPGTIDRDGLAARLGEVVLLDARAPERYRGEVEPLDPVAGHIPTARNAPVGGNLGPDGRFLAPEVLRARFAALGADGTAEVVTSCGSGVSALHNALAMRVVGLADPTLYVGSFSDWSRSGMPVATGPEPGAPPEKQGRATVEG